MNTTKNTPATTTDAVPARRGRKRVCRFCADPYFFLDYKEPQLLFPFVNDRGKIVPRRITGNCAFHQRRLQEAVKRARILALLPYAMAHMAGSGAY